MDFFRASLDITNRALTHHLSDERAGPKAKALVAQAVSAGDGKRLNCMDNARCRMDSPLLGLNCTAL